MPNSDTLEHYYKMKNKEGKQYQSSIDNSKRKRLAVKGVVNARGVIEKRKENRINLIGALGIPGRFSVIGRGIHVGVRHFSDASG